MSLPYQAQTDVGGHMEQRWHLQMREEDSPVSTGLWQVTGMGVWKWKREQTHVPSTMGSNLRDEEAVAVGDTEGGDGVEMACLRVRMCAGAG